MSHNEDPDVLDVVALLELLYVSLYPETPNKARQRLAEIREEVAAR